MTTKDIEQKLIKLLQEELGQETVSLDQTLDDLGADSLDYMDIILAVEDAFDVEIENEAWEEKVKTDSTTVEQIVGFIGEQLEADL